MKAESYKLRCLCHSLCHKNWAEESRISLTTVHCQSITFLCARKIFRPPSPDFPPFTLPPLLLSPAVSSFSFCLFLFTLRSLSLQAGMWSRSRRLGLETVSRRTNVSSRSRLGQNPQRSDIRHVRLDENHRPLIEWPWRSLTTTSVGYASDSWVSCPTCYTCHSRSTIRTLRYVRLSVRLLSVCAVKLWCTEWNVIWQR